MVHIHIHIYIYMVHIWLIYGLCMVDIWFMYGKYMVNQHFSWVTNCKWPCSIVLSVYKRVYTIKKNSIGDGENMVDIWFIHG